MKKNDKPSGMIVFVIVVALLLIVTHCEDSINRIPGVHVESNGMSVDIGDFHYHS